MKTEVENFNKEIDGLVEMAILSNNFDEVCGIHKKTTDLFEQIRFENDDDEGSELIKFKHAVNALDKIASRMYRLAEAA